MFYNNFEFILLSVKANFIHDPKITILDDTAKIHFLISGPLTHIIEENCVTDTALCTNYNINIPNDNHIWLVQNTIRHDFYEDVPLADSEASQFVFSFWMYDGDDLLYSVPDVIHVDIGGGKNLYIYI